MQPELVAFLTLIFFTGADFYNLDEYNPTSDVSK